jgi:hypothetical protein
MDSDADNFERAIIVGETAVVTSRARRTVEAARMIR